MPRQHIVAIVNERLNAHILRAIIAAPIFVGIPN